MRTAITTVILALASSVLAQTPGFDVISKPTKDEVIPAGSTYLIDWEPSTNWTGPVTIDVLGGPNQGGLQPLSVLAKGVDSAAGQYSWAVDKTLGTLNTYGIRITLESDPTIFQYSFPFVIKASADGKSSSSSSSGSTESSTTSPSSTSSGAAGTTVTTVTTPTITSAPTGGNLSTTGTPSKTLVTTTTTGTSKTSPTGSTVPSNPGAIVRASSVALLGGFALAFFAL